LIAEGEGLRLKGVVLGLLIFAGFSGFCGAQEAGVSPEGVAAAAEEAGTEAESGGGLPRSFHGIGLGMNLGDLKAVLEKNGLFDFRGDRDVSYLPSKTENLVETTGRSFVRRAFFQLREDSLFIMGYMMNTALVDHYSIYTTFVKKYGEPVSLNPHEAVWENEDTRVSIERPLTVKYIDKKIFNSIIEESKLSGAVELELRREFLDDF
jgi:hypothetical protein